MNIGRVNHTAVVVADMDEAVPRWSALLGARLELRQFIEHQGVEIAMLLVGDTTVELIQPVSSPGVQRFLDRRGESLHHIGLAVPDIREAMKLATESGMELIDTEPRFGVHGLIAFIHPRSTGGVLLEFVER